MRIVLAVILSIMTFSAFGQVGLNRRITLRVENITLDDLFRILISEHGVKIAFGADNIPLSLKISLNSFEEPLSEVLEVISSEANLSYQIIGDVIVFRYSGAANFAESLAHGTHSGITVAHDSSQFSRIAMVDSISLDISIPRISLKEEESSIALQREWLPELKQVQAPSMVPTGVNGRKILFYQSGVFLSYSFDYHDFDFIERDLSFQVYKRESNGSFTLGGYVALTPKIYLSADVGYGRRDFRLEYNYQVLDPNDPLPIPDRTLVELGYLRTPLMVGYRLFSFGQYYVSLTGGVSASFLLHKDETTSYHNQNNQQTDHFLPDNQLRLYSASVRLVFHRSFIHSLGMFISPGLSYSGQPVNEKVMEPRYKSYHVNAGLQFDFGHAK